MTTIAHVTPFYPPALGGLERVAAALAEGLAATGHDVRVITTTAGAHDRPRREPSGGVRVQRSRAVVLAHTPLAPGLVWALLRLPRTSVVHVHVAHALTLDVVRWVCAVRRMPYLAHLHLDVDASGPAGRLLPAYKRLFLGPALRGARRVITLSPEMADFVTTAYAVPADRVVVLRNGVDERFFAGARPSRAEGPLRLLFAGRLAAQKNVARLLSALALVTAEVRLDVVGDGEDRDRLEKAAADLGLAHVVFHGSVDTDALVARMGEADALVLPSDKEGQPLIALEAMAAGLPVIATDVPGNRELLNGVGLLVAPDPAALAAGIDAWAAHPVRRSDAAAAGRAAAEAHHWSDVAADVAGVYADAGLL